MDDLAQSQAGSGGGLTTAPNEGRAAAFDGEDDFCLADRMALASDEELEQMAEEDAECDVSSSAYAGIPLDKAALKAGLIESYKKLRAERAAAQPPPVDAVAPAQDKVAPPDPEDFCLADRMAVATDAELEQMAEEDADSTVSSSAYEGIPLDGAALRAELIESYKKLRAEWPTQRRERMAENERISRRQPPIGQESAKSPQTRSGEDCPSPPVSKRWLWFRRLFR